MLTAKYFFRCFSHDGQRLSGGSSPPPTHTEPNCKI